MKMAQLNVTFIIVGNATVRVERRQMTSNDSKSPRSATEEATRKSTACHLTKARASGGSLAHETFKSLPKSERQDASMKVDADNVKTVNLGVRANK